MLRSRRIGAMRDVELYRTILGVTAPRTVASVDREARGEAEEQDGGQGGEGADGGMREQEAGASRKTNAYRNFFLTGLGLRIYLSRQVYQGKSSGV
jgi:hypothetical protein